MDKLAREGDRAWIEAGGLLVEVHRTDEGVVVDIWPSVDAFYNADTNDEPIAGTWAEFPPDCSL
jgi:hypothetical protein